MLKDPSPLYLIALWCYMPSLRIQKNLIQLAAILALNASWVVDLNEKSWSQDVRSATMAQTISVQHRNTK